MKLRLLLAAMLFSSPTFSVQEEEKSKQEAPKPDEPELNPEKEGHSHGEDEYKRRQTDAHGEDKKLCKTWGYCSPSGHDPSSWKEFLPEDITLHACPKIASCHPEKPEHNAQYCGDEKGKGVRSHCDQSCREQCCFCCGSP